MQKFQVVKEIATQIVQHYIRTVMKVDNAMFNTVLAVLENLVPIHAL